MNLRPALMKAFFISALLFIPSLKSMIVERTSDSETAVRVLERNGATPLHVAAYFDRVDEIEKLLVEGASVTAVDNDCATPLHLAAKMGCLRAAACLIVHGAHVDCRDTFSFTPLYYATKERHLGVIQCLQEQGAEISIIGDQRRFTAVHTAALNGDLPALECMMKMRSVNGRLDSLVALADCSNSPLHCAAENGSREVIDFLIMAGESVSVRDANGNTPLLIAARHGHVDALRCLLNHGASLDEQNQDYQRAAYCAAKGGHVEMLQFLIDQKVNIDFCLGQRAGYFVRPPLLCAFDNGHVRAVELLLRNSERIWAQSLLMTAARFGRVTMLKVLLNNGIPVDGRDNVKLTALHHAVESAQVEAAEILIRQGASLGLEPRLLDHAIKGSCHDRLSTYNPRRLRCIQLLLNAGAPVHEDTVKAAAPHLALIRMLINAHPECLGYVLNIRDVNSFLSLRLPDEMRIAVKEYIEKRAYYISEKCFHEGDNPDSILAVAAHFLDWHVLRIFKDRWLVQLRSWRDPKGKNLLMGAFEMRDLEIIRWLVEEKICDINDVDPEGNDVLWRAIGSDDMSLINEILAGGASVKAEHLIYAASLCNYEIIARLALLYRYSECRDDRKPAGLNLFR